MRRLGLVYNPETTLGYQQNDNPTTIQFIVRDRKRGTKKSNIERIQAQNGGDYAIRGELKPNNCLSAIYWPNYMSIQRVRAGTEKKSFHRPKNFQFRPRRPIQPARESRPTQLEVFLSLLFFPPFLLSIFHSPSFQTD